MLAHCFYSKNLISIIGFLATFRLLNGTNRIYEAAKMWMVSYYMHETIANALDCGMHAKNRPAPIIVLVRNNDSRSRKLLRSYSGAVIYLSRRVLRINSSQVSRSEALVKPTSCHESQLYVHDLVTESFKFSDVYHEKPWAMSLSKVSTHTCIMASVNIGHKTCNRI